LMAEHEETLARRFIDFIDAKPQVHLIGRDTADKTQRAPTFSFVVGGRDSREFPGHLIKSRIAIRSGTFYAQRCIDALGLGSQNGVVRVSMVHYNSMEEVDRLIARLDEVL
jgi:selenocysteine lyase/cysteine desulfurase